MTLYLIIILTTLAAGIIQGISGFGAGLIVMSVVPYFLPLISCAGISNFMSVFLCANMSWHYRKYIKWQAIAIPAVFFIIGGTLAIWLAPTLNTENLKAGFGVFLVVLSIYFFFFSSRMKIQASLPTMFLCGFISGICDGLFGVGGPLMVLYYLNLTSSKEEYLGTIQTFFLFTVTWNFLFRVMRGMFPLDLLEESIASVFGVYIGIAIGTRLISRIDGELLKKGIYALIGISGIITLLTSL